MAIKTVKFYATQLTSYYGTSNQLGRSSAGEGGTHSFTLNKITYNGYFAGLRGSSSNRYGTKMNFTGSVSEEGYKLSDLTFSQIQSVKFNFIRKPCYTNNTYGVSLHYTIPTGDITTSAACGNAIITTNRVSFSASSAPSSTVDGTVSLAMSLNSTKWTQLLNYGIFTYFGNTSSNIRHVFIGDVWLEIVADFPDLTQQLYYNQNGTLKVIVPYCVQGGNLIQTQAGIVDGSNIIIF